MLAVGFLLLSPFAYHFSPPRKALASFPFAEQSLLAKLSLLSGFAGLVAVLAAAWVSL